VIRTSRCFRCRGKLTACCSLRTDWEAACGLVFPNSFEDGKAKPRDLFTEENFRKFERSWDDGRVATAFFRGTATGGGTKVENNQRLKVADLSDKWKNDPVKGGAEPYLDAAIVGWNSTLLVAVWRLCRWPGVLCCSRS
jgi:hypothetical protein